jgi:ElaA protein
MIQVRGVQYRCKSFDQLTTEELYTILQVRELVFTLEQQVFYKDIDDKDQLCYHLIGYKNNELVSYCRINVSYCRMNNAKSDSISFGRVLTPPHKRRQGFGVQLINQAIIVCKTLTNADITIKGQAYLEKFYSDFGFKKHGEPYMYEGIEHIDMSLNTRDVNILNDNQSKIYRNLG